MSEIEDIKRERDEWRIRAEAAEMALNFCAPKCYECDIQIIKENWICKECSDLRNCDPYCVTCGDHGGCPDCTFGFPTS